MFLMDKERQLCEKNREDFHGEREAIAFDGMFIRFMSLSLIIYEYILRECGYIFSENVNKC